MSVQIRPHQDISPEQGNEMQYPFAMQAVRMAKGKPLARAG
jgi:hypothetical protein